jgi:hypothetical protein
MPRATAAQCAALSVERFRLELLADHLWLLQQRKEAAAAGADCGPTEVPMTRARAELDYIENSRTWRMVRRLKKSRLYRTWARVVHGRDWQRGMPTSDDPRERLAAIKRSRFYRLIQRIKRTRLYEWYARRKYGVEFARSPFSEASDPRAS